MKKNTILLLFAITLGLSTSAQYSSRKVGKKQQAYTDSLKTVEYNYVFPAWGQAVYKKGFDIPYSTGAMANYIWMEQGIVIDNFQLGIKTDNIDLPLTPVDFIDFGTNTNTSYSVNFRPDIWVLPFLNVSGIFGYGASTTEVNLTAPVVMKSIVTQGLSTAGFGVMGAFGLGPLWMSVDGNWTWTKPELLDDAVLAKVLGIRLGKTFVFKSKPEQNVAFWVGGMRVKMSSETIGNIKMADAFPEETWAKKDEIVEDYNTWYDGLGPVMKEKVDDSAIPVFMERFEAADGSTMISYGMDKKPEQEWNVLFGAQYQFNKHWQIRSEAGLIGDRKSFLLSANYRFLGFKKK
ncbi:MAG: hypothetical protein GQ525_16695 [Draconibacterium sp.]|nr:hypothetical protein [Draconibacterium sp.]